MHQIVLACSGDGKTYFIKTPTFFLMPAVSHVLYFYLFYHQDLNIFSSLVFVFLGNDSKTLMLVHISPEEEDLCETLCSLNFATRVRSVHLGNKDSTVSKCDHLFSILNLTNYKFLLPFYFGQVTVQIKITTMNYT